MSPARLLRPVALFQTTVASQLPVLLAGKLFLPGLPVPGQRMAIASAVSLAIGATWLIAGARDATSMARRASAFSLFVILLIAYPAVAQLLGVALSSSSDTRLAIAYLLLVPAGVWLAVHAWRAEVQMLSLITAILVTISAAAIWMAGWGGYIRGVGPAWESAREAIARPVRLGDASSSDPDILHIVLDGFGRPDTLSDEYHIAPEQFAVLSDEGLHVAPDAVANYSFTYQAFAAMLNMQYLDQLSEPLHLAEDRRPLVELFRESSVVRSLKDRGYEFVLVGSVFDITSDHPLADTCINCGPAVPGLFETALLSISPFRALGLWGPIFNAHRERIASSVERLVQMPASGGQPRFILAHLLIPHPPFLHGPDGPLPNPHRAFEILDEALYRGPKSEYLEGYAAQVAYALKAVAAIVAHARATARRRLVIIVNGDHGPGLEFNSERLTEAGLRERMTILLASSWPDGERHDELRSPVNVYRVVFNTCFQARLPLLADRSLVPLEKRPYQSQEIAEGAWHAPAPVRSVGQLRGLK